MNRHAFQNPAIQINLLQFCEYAIEHLKKSDQSSHDPRLATIVGPLYSPCSTVPWLQGKLRLSARHLCFVADVRF